MSEQIQVVTRALKILEVLVREDVPVPLADIATRTDLPKSTVHRLIKALEHDFYVRQTSPGQYHVGRALVCMGAQVIRGSLIFNAAAPMRALRDATGCTVYLSTINNNELVYLHRAPAAVSPTSDTGISGNFFCSTGGRAILSTYPDEKIYKIFEKKRLSPSTPYSITDKEAFMEEIRNTRSRGYSKSINEYTIGVEGIGVPLYDSTGECIAALSLVAVAGTISVSVEEYVWNLQKTARDISELLGYI